MMNILNRMVITETTQEKSISRIGGCMPIYFLDKYDLISNLNFYACVEHPFDNKLSISIFIPKNYIELSEGKIYPDCSVKVFIHEYSDESDDEKHICKDLNKIYLMNYINDASEEGIIQVGGEPEFIQEEDYYFKELEKDGYVFFMKIDEAFYPDDLVVDSYPFNFGALYLYCKVNDANDIIAGFWQCS